MTREDNAVAGPWLFATAQLLLVLSAMQAAAQTRIAPVAAQKHAESRNMALVGYHDLQGRAAYQPIIKKQGDRWIAYIGHHGGTQRNVLTGTDEPNGTSILDVTDPRRPTYLAHIPGEPIKGNTFGDTGGAQMVRVCGGNELPRADRSKFYLLRPFGNQSHEMWDVTDPSKPVRLNVIVDGLRNTHKSWWECDGGIAYLVSGAPGWNTPRMALIYDLGDPAKPVFIRSFGLPGQQPGAARPTTDRLHGPISTGPAGNRVYFAYGNLANGIFEIVDRDKLLRGPAEPTDENLSSPVIARVNLPQSVSAHTAFPLLQMNLPEFAGEPEDRVKDFLAIVGEAGADGCSGHRQMLRIFEITGEARPFGVSTWTVPERSGKFCERGGRFGSHASNESFTPVYYNRVLFLSHFSAGVRAIDVRDPFQPREIAYYIPALNGRTQETCNGEGPAARCATVIQTNGVEVDDRGYIYITDRVGSGLHILALTGPARQAAARSQTP